MVNKDEFLEDIEEYNEDSLIRIYADGIVFEGTLIKCRDKSVKLKKLDGTSSTIQFDSMTSYEEILKSDDNTEIITDKDKIISCDETKETVDATKKISNEKEIVVNAERFLKHAYENKPIPMTLDMLKKEIKLAKDSDDYDVRIINSLIDRLQNAIAKHEDSPNSNRMWDIRASSIKCHKDNPDDKFILHFLGIYFNHTKSYVKSLNYFLQGMAYDSALYIANKMGDKEQLLSCATEVVLSTQPSLASMTIIHELAQEKEWAVYDLALRQAEKISEYNLHILVDFTEALLTVKKNDISWFISEEIERYSIKHIEILRNIIAQEITDNTLVDKFLLEEKTKKEKQERKEILNQKKNGTFVHKGKIVKWNSEKKYGFINAEDIPENIYFFIRQVYSKKLREMLYIGEGWNYAVTFTLGCNIHGSNKEAPAANHIELHEDKQEKMAEGQRLHGTIIYYNRWQEYGSVRAADTNQSYTFQRNNILDADLILYLYQYGSDYMEWPVTFSFSARKGKKQIVDLISVEDIPKDEWTDITILKPQEIKKWNEYQKGRDAAIDKFSYSNEEQDSYFMEYEELPPFDETKKRQQVISKTSVMPTIVNKKEKLAQKSGQDIFASIERGSIPKATTSCYAMGHRCMINKQLDKAIAFFKEAIKSDDNISSTVSDLFSIYIAIGKETRNYDDAFSLMNHYGHCLTREKRLNHMITLYSASKVNDEELIRYYREAIDLTSYLNRKLQFTKIIADLQQRNGMYQASLDSCDEWRQYAKHSNTPIMPSEENYISRVRCFALYGLGHRDEAIKSAKQLLQIYPDNETLKQIMEGRSDVSLNDSSEKMLQMSVQAFDNLPEFLRNKVENVSIDNIKSTKYVTDAEIINKPSIDQLHEEYNIIRRKSGSMGAKMTADWALVTTKYIRNCLMLWPTIYNKELEDAVINQENMIRELQRAIRSEIQYQLSLSNPDIDTVRYYCLLLIDSEFAKDDKQTINKTLIEDISGDYLDTYFKDDDSLQKLFAKENTKHTNVVYIKEKKRDFFKDDFQYGLHKLLHRLIGWPEEFIGKSLERICTWLKLNNEELFDGQDPLGRTIQELEKANDKIDPVMNTKIEQFYQEQNRQEMIFDDRMDFGSKDFVKNLMDALQCMRVCKAGRTCNHHLADILAHVRTLQDEKSFTNRTQELRNILNDIDSLRNKIEMTPTEYTYNKLLLILNNLRQWTHEEYRKQFTKNSAPEIKVEVKEANTADGKITVVWRVYNSSGRQTADNPSLSIYVGNRFLSLDPVSIDPIGSEPQDIAQELKPVATIGEIESFDWTVNIKYEYYLYPEDGDEQKRVENSYQVSSSTSLKGKSFEKIPNPFESLTNSGPIDPEKQKEMIFGREDEIESVIGKLLTADNRLQSQRALALYGQKRSGKTTLLNCVKTQIKKRFPEAICIDFDSVGALDRSSDDGFISALETKVLSSLRDYVDDDDDLSDLLAENCIALDYDKLIGNPAHSVLFEREMKGFERCLKQVHPEAQVILFLDEFTYLYTDILQEKLTRRVLEYWKAFMQTYSCSCIIVGQDSMEQLQDEHQNEMGAFKLQRVDYLKEKDTRDMLFQPLQKSEVGQRVQVEDDAYKRLYEYSAGSAFWHIILCSCLVHYLNEHHIYNVTRQLVDNMVEEELRTGDSISLPLFEPLYNDSECTKINNRDKDNIRVMNAIAHACTVAHPFVAIPELSLDMETAKIEKLIKALVHRKVLDDKKEKYSIRVGLFQQFLLHNNGEESA